MELRLVFLMRDLHFRHPRLRPGINAMAVIHFQFIVIFTLLGIFSAVTKQHNLPSWAPTVEQNFKARQAVLIRTSK